MGNVSLQAARKAWPTLSPSYYQRKGAGCHTSKYKQSIFRRRTKLTSRGWI